MQLNNSYIFYNITTQPGESTTYFILFCKNVRTKSFHLLTYDFKNIFNRSCSLDDYENITVSSCALGESTIYEKRKRTSECLNTNSYKEKMYTESCQCTRNDFECDYGFVLTDDKCKVDIHAKEFTPKCINYWYRSSGYHKKPGNKCVPPQTNAAMKLEPDIVPCSVLNDKNEFILFTNGRQIKKHTLNTNRTETLVELTSSTITAFDFDPKSDFIYWTEKGSQKLKRAAMENPKKIEEIAINGIFEVADMSIDWVSGNIYLIDKAVNSIVLITPKKEMKQRKLITKGDKFNNSQMIVNSPKSLVVNPSLGYVYWSDYDENNASNDNSYIASAWLDGTNAEVLINSISN